MITTSQAWKDYSRDVGIFHIKAVIDNGTQMTLTDEDFMQGSVNITDSISGMSDFTVGAVITNSFNATLNNFSGKFNNYNLAGARISVQFGIIFDDESEEWIDRGIYTLEKPTSLGSTIKVVGYDDMDKLNRYYIGKDADFNDITFPIPADDLAEILCDYCGVTFGDWELSTDNVAEFEYDESTTCRQVLSWIMQAWGGYARINPQGTLDCKKFNQNAWTLGVEMDGGSINPWGGADTVNGGVIDPWSAITDYDGGENGHIDFTLSKIKSLNVYVEDIAVTGIRAYAYNTVDEFQFDTVGTGGYVLAIQDNPLVTDNTLAVATRVYNATKDLKFRPFDASIIGDPSIEAGDIIALQDYLGNAHVSLITSLTYSVNSAERLECNAKTPEEADLETANPQTSVIKGATMASYDYILAKKISADYIAAGTIEAAVIAKNFTMDGGKIQVTTDDGENDVITLNYNGRETALSPYSIKRYYNNDICYFLGSESGNPGAGYLELYANQIKRIVLGATQGRVLLKDANGVNRIYMEADSGDIVIRDASDVSRIFMDSASGSIVMRDGSNTSQIFMDSANSSSYFQGRLAIGGNTYYTGYALSLFGSAYASGSWNQGSLEELKDDIKTPDIDPIDVLNNTDIYQFVYKSDKENGLNNVVYGAIIGDGYNCDEHLMSANKDSISPYSMTSILWMIVQKQQKQIEALEKRVAELESLNEKKEK